MDFIYIKVYPNFQTGFFGECTQIIHLLPKVWYIHQKNLFEN